MDLDDALLETEEAMEKSVAHLKAELRGVRSGRASTALVEFIKVECYGSMAELRQLALISVPEPTMIVIKPFAPETLQTIVKAIQSSGLGLNPNAEGKQIRLAIPALSGERRREMVSVVKKKGEDAKVTVRNARRDGNKKVDQAEKDKTLHLSEDDAKGAKNDIQDLVKNYEKQIEGSVAAKAKEIEGI